MHNTHIIHILKSVCRTYKVHTNAGRRAAAPYSLAANLQTLPEAISSECEARVTLVGGE